MTGRKLIVGNWKMHGLKGSIAEIDALLQALPHGVDCIVCPPLTLVALFAEHAADRIGIGAQDVAAQTGFAARTGEVSAEMLKDAGASAVIVGHSERREHHREDDTTVRAKAEAARDAGLMPIVCVGEREEERDAGRALSVITGQVRRSLPRGGDTAVIAYEPVWAIGSGRTPSEAEIAEAHAAIREEAGRKARVLYGGSVKAANAGTILAIPGVDGALVGGASLKAAEFLAILQAGAACAAAPARAA